jgi:membrane carboxypeptidase/penicillin-binding protein
MRTFLKILLGFIAAIAILIGAAVSWFFFYSGDLPEIDRLAQFAPATNTSVSDPCLETASVAIPYEAMGGNFRNALSAVEVRLHDQISRTMFCTPAKVLSRQLKEIRTAAQLKRHFSPQQLFTIYANRTGFGGGLIGVQSASQYFFHKNPAELSIAEAALLAGLVQEPSYLSPVRHPDRALKRRDQVIDAMVQAGSITVPEADAAKNAPLGIAIEPANSRVQ